MGDYIFSKLFDDFFEIQKLNINAIKTQDTDIDRTLTGKYSECLFTYIIKNFLPSNIEIANGWIVDEQGDKTYERDIIIYDRNKAPVFLFNIGTGMIPQCSVLYDIQIKTTLNDSDRFCKTIKKFKEGPYKNAIFSIFGKNQLQSYIKLDKNYILNPKIKILSSEEDAVYYFKTREIKYSDIFSKEKIFKKIKNQYVIEENAVPKRLIINNIDVDEALDKTLKINEWRQIKCNTKIKAFTKMLLDELYEDGISKYLNDKKDFIDKPVIRAIFDSNNNLVEGSLFKDLEQGLTDNYHLDFSMNFSRDTNTIKNKNEQKVIIQLVKLEPPGFKSSV